MNNVKVKVYKKLPKKVVQKNNGTEVIINNRIDEICTQERFSDEKVIYFDFCLITVYVPLLSFQQ